MLTFRIPPMMLSKASKTPQVAPRPDIPTIVALTLEVVQFQRVFYFHGLIKDTLYPLVKTMRSIFSNL